MKKLIFLFFVLFFLLTILLPIGALHVSASESEIEFLRVINVDTPFYSDETLTDFITYLPETYYVKIISESDTYVHVEYCPSNLSIEGYVPKNKLFFDETTPENPYPFFQIKTCENSMMYSSFDTKTPVAYLFSNKSLNYIGYAFNNDGEKVYTVFYNDVLGYIPYKSVYPFSLPEHPNPKTYIKPKEDVKEDITADSGSILKWVIIGLLVLAGLLSLFLIKKPKKEKTAYYDENDYN